jgi:hypothetical protein
MLANKRFFVIVDWSLEFQEPLRRRKKPGQIEKMLDIPAII